MMWGTSSVYSTRMRARSSSSRAGRADYVGEDLLHAAQDHQRRGGLAHDLVRDEGSAEKLWLLPEQPEEVFYAAFAEQTDLVAVADHAGAFLREQTLFEPPSFVVR